MAEKRKDTFQNNFFHIILYLTLNSSVNTQSNDRSEKWVTNIGREMLVIKSGQLAKLGLMKQLSS